MALVFRLCCCLFVAVSGGSAGELTGDWVGGFRDGDDYVYLQLHFSQTEEGLSGKYDAPLLFQNGRSLKNLTANANSVSFEIPTKSMPAAFSGEMKGGVLEGQMKEGPVRTRAQFTRVASIQQERYIGTYEAGPGEFVFLRAGVELGLNGLQFINFKNGRVGAMFPTTKTNFFTGPGVLVLDPIEAHATFSFDGDGRAEELIWKGRDEWTGRRTHLREQEIFFTNGNVRLAGSLILPQTGGPHPVVICAAGGTAAATREMFRHMAEFFAVHGVASFIYDKRGLGASSGDWLRAGFHDLAADVLAAVGALKQHPGIEGRRIGLFGASQSGWIVALAASQSKEVAFIISQSGPGVTPEEQELFRSEAWLRADGFSEEDIRQCMNFIRQRYKCALTGEGWDALAETEREAKKQKWYSYTGGHVGKDHPFWHFWSLIRGYQPVPDLEKVTCPVLAIFGDKDTFLPAQKSADIWEKALQKAGNKRATIRVFSNADHSLVESKTGGLKEAARARRFVPGFFELVRDWTLQQTKFFGGPAQP